MLSSAVTVTLFNADKEQIPDSVVRWASTCCHDPPTSLFSSQTFSILRVRHLESDRPQKIPFPSSPPVVSLLPLPLFPWDKVSHCSPDGLGTPSNLPAQARDYRCATTTQSLYDSACIEQACECLCRHVDWDNERVFLLLWKWIWILLLMVQCFKRLGEFKSLKPI